MVVAGHAVQSNFKWPKLTSNFVDCRGKTVIFNGGFPIHVQIRELQAILDKLMRANGYGPLPGDYHRETYESGDPRLTTYFTLVTAYQWWMFHSTLYPRMKRENKLGIHFIDKYMGKFHAFFSVFIGYKLPLTGIVDLPFPAELYAYLDETFPDGCTERCRIGCLQSHDHYRKIALFGTTEDVVKTAISLLRNVIKTMTCMLDVVNFDCYQGVKHKRDDEDGESMPKRRSS